MTFTTPPGARSVPPPKVTFGDSAHLLADATSIRRRVFKRTSVIGDVWKTIRSSFGCGDNDLFGIAIHNEIWIVSKQHDLAAILCRFEIRRQKLVNRLVVQIFVWLIHNQRARVIHVNSKIEDQEHNSLCPR